MAANIEIFTRDLGSGMNFLEFFVFCGHRTNPAACNENIFTINSQISEMRSNVCVVYSTKDQNIPSISKVFQCKRVPVMWTASSEDLYTSDIVNLQRIHKTSIKKFYFIWLNNIRTILYCDFIFQMEYSSTYCLLICNIESRFIGFIMLK